MEPKTSKLPFSYPQKPSEDIFTDNWIFENSNFVCSNELEITELDLLSTLEMSKRYLNESRKELRCEGIRKNSVPIFKTKNTFDKLSSKNSESRVKPQFSASKSVKIHKKDVIDNKAENENKSSSGKQFQV